MVTIEPTIVVFAVGLLIGGFAIYVGAALAFKSKDYSHAVLTALFGAVAWAIVNAAFEAVNIQGALSSLVGLIVWIWVIRWRYRVGWLRGALIGLVAWFAALVALSILSTLGVSGLGPYGVPTGL